MTETRATDEPPKAPELSEVPDGLHDGLSRADMKPCVEDDLPLLGDCYTD